MNFTKELEELSVAEKQVEIAQEKLAKRFVLEVMKGLAKFKRDKYDFTCGMGTYFFSKNDKIVHDEEKLPYYLKRLINFYEEHDYIARYVSNITLSGGKNETRKQRSPKRGGKDS
jgi:asparagine synthetase A